MICLRLASLAWSLLILSNISFGYDFEKFCARRCMMGRGGILCRCNAMHFTGKRSGADTNNDLDIPSKETLQQVVMNQLARLVSENEERDLFLDSQNRRSQKTRDMLAKLIYSGEMEPYFGQKDINQENSRYSSLFRNTRSLLQAKGESDFKLRNSYSGGKSIDLSGKHGRDLSLNKRNDEKTKELGASNSVDSLIGDNKNEERVNRLIDNVMTRLDDYEKNNKESLPSFADSVDAKSSSHAQRYGGVNSDSAEDSLIGDVRGRGNGRSARSRDVRTLTATSAHKRRLEEAEITPRESRSKLSAILPLLTSVNERNTAMADYLPTA